MGATDHVDVETLEMLKEVMEDGFQALLETYIGDAQARIEAIRSALAKQQLDELRREAHSLKGSSGNLGAHHIAALAKFIEDNAREGSTSGATETLTKIEVEYKEVASVLNAMLGK